MHFQRTSDAVRAVHEVNGRVIQGKKLKVSVAQKCKDQRGLCNLFVAGLSEAVTNDWLREKFSVFGEVIDAKVLTEPATGKSRCVGFVRFTDQEPGIRAIKSMHGIPLMCRGTEVRMVVRLAEDHTFKRRERFAGPRRGGKGGGRGHHGGGKGMGRHHQHQGQRSHDNQTPHHESQQAQPSQQSQQSQQPQQQQQQQQQQQYTMGPPVIHHEPAYQPQNQQQWGVVPQVQQQQQQQQYQPQQQQQQQHYAPYGYSQSQNVSSNGYYQPPAGFAAPATHLIGGYANAGDSGTSSEVRQE